MRAAITADLVRKLPEASCEMWDTIFPGLVLRVRESGRASYVVVYGRGKNETLGRADALTPAEVRKLARGVIGDVSHGRDPQAEGGSGARAHSASFSTGSMRRGLRRTARRATKP